MNKDIRRADPDPSPFRPHISQLHTIAATTYKHFQLHLPSHICTAYNHGQHTQRPFLGNLFSPQPHTSAITPISDQHSMSATESWTSTSTKVGSLGHNPYAEPEPAFDPAVHLAYQPPAERLTMDQLGLGDVPTPVSPTASDRYTYYHPAHMTIHAPRYPCSHPSPSPRPSPWPPSKASRPCETRSFSPPASTGT